MERIEDEAPKADTPTKRWCFILKMFYSECLKFQISAIFTFDDTGFMGFLRYEAVVFEVSLFHFAS